jgi:2-polyprenyl-3-methyl-5-hydroxy-6-metoxy-1,4-benzoquinol methylase
MIISDKNWLQRHNKDLWKIFDLKKSFKPDSVILDFGCNNANFLIDAKKHCPGFNEKNYVGVDVNKSFIEVARKRFPNYKFFHHPSYHSSYNPTHLEKKNTSETLKEFQFDIIIAYSVFTHCSSTETKKILDDLVSLLKPGGMILYSLLTSENMFGFLNFNHIKYKTKLTKNIYNELLNKKFEKTAYWIDYQRCIVDEPEYSENCETFICFYKSMEIACSLHDSHIAGYHRYKNIRLQSIFQKVA